MPSQQDRNPQVLDRDPDTELTPKRPSMWNVILHNDDYTPMEFVVLVLIEIFHKSPELAAQLMLTVHTKDKAIIGTYTHEIAESYIAATMELAKQQEYPLRCTMEKNEDGDG